MKLFFNAQFHTIMEEGDIVTAVLVDDQGYIKETYIHTPEMENIEMIDLHNDFVYPGFNQRVQGNPGDSER